MNAKQKVWPVQINILAAAYNNNAFANLTADSDDFIRSQVLIEQPDDKGEFSRSLAFRVAEKFRDEGRDILFFVDNIYRFTLAGTEVSPAVLRRRFAGVRRVWLVTIRGIQQPPPDTRTDEAKIALIKQLHLLGRWHAGAITVRLYAR
jgi:hypothetical protein